MTPATSPEHDMVIDQYRIPATVYRKQLEAIRAFSIRGDEHEFKNIHMESELDQVTRKEGQRLLDDSAKSDYDGVSLISLSRFYEFISFVSKGKQDVELMSQRIHDAMGMVERMPEKRPFEYTPDPEVIRPLIEKLDEANVPNYMRSKHLESEHGAACDHNELGVGKFESADAVRKAMDDIDEDVDVKEGTKRRKDDDEEEEVMVEEF
jgi:hypothetical protein